MPLPRTSLNPVEHDGYLEHIARQAEAFRAAAVKAGPEAEVPTCPKWNVLELLRHLGGVYAWVQLALATAPDAEPPAAPASPRSWDEVLPWWDEQLAELLRALAGREPDAPAWAFRNGRRTAGFWFRRQAHETAIHRLDAEHALAQSASPAAVPTLLFDPRFAADGIDEFLTVFIAGAPPRQPVDAERRVMFHAADAGRHWVAQLRPGQPVEIGPPEGSEVADDASIVGTADAVYRAVWSRPSTALISGDKALIGAFAAP
jgi:uncharacterized protein (TIGR03083 family)